MTSRQCVEVASKFYRAQSAMKFLHGENYRTRVAEFSSIIQKVADSHKCETIPATQICIEKIVERDPYDNGVVVAMLLAAAVEMVEGPAAGETPEASKT